MQRLHLLLSRCSRPVQVRRQVSAAQPSAAPAPYPWRALRDWRGRLTGVQNASDRALGRVRFYVAGAGAFGFTLPSTLRPRESLSFAVRPMRGEVGELLVVVRWHDPIGGELVTAIPYE